MDQWRASKVDGVGVYGQDGKKLGDIKDVLMDHDGKAQVVVIGVGGVLAVRSKDVGVPFAALHWQTDSKTAPTNGQSGNTTGAMTGAQGNQNPPARTDAAAVEAHQGYPDRAVIDMTLAQLKSAPDFKYAPDPTANADMRSSPNGTEQKSTP